MYCLKCKEHRDGAYCPECGSKLVEDPVSGIGGLHLGDANAISGGVHYSETNNVTNNVTNNNTYVYEAQKTESEIIRENEGQFQDFLFGLISQGPLGVKELTELERLRVRLRISEPRANEMIQGARKSASFSGHSQVGVFLEDSLIQSIKEAISFCRKDYLMRQNTVLKSLAESSQDDEVHFYHQLLTASFFPESSVVSLASAMQDDYWLVFWGYVSYLKLENPGGAASLLSQLGKYGRSKGDVLLLLSMGSLYDFKHGGGEHSFDLIDRYLEQAAQEGVDEKLIPIWRSVKGLIDGTDDESLRFYHDVTLKEFSLIQIGHDSPSAPSFPGAEFSVQNIQLPQMQGFNPLAAANQLGLGRISDIQTNQFDNTPNNE